MPNQFDFSKLERISPREDSWERVCARLDAQEGSECKNRGKAIPFHIYSAIPLAASLVLVALTLLLFSASGDSANIIQTQGRYTEVAAVKANPTEISTHEISTWYKTLGRSSSDDLETLDEAPFINYLLKEAK